MTTGKNEINKILVKGLDYLTEVRIGRNGRSYTVYKCTKQGCTREFMRTNNLLDHIRMHEGVKPYSCDYCGKSFTQNSNLKKHKKVHLVPQLNDRKQYQCNVCGAKYTERYNYRVSCYVNS